MGNGGSERSKVKWYVPSCYPGKSHLHSTRAKDRKPISTQVAAWEQSDSSQEIVLAGSGGSFTMDECSNQKGDSIIRLTQHNNQQEWPDYFSRSFGFSEIRTKLWSEHLIHKPVHRPISKIHLPVVLHMVINIEIDVREDKCCKGQGHIGRWDERNTSRHLIGKETHDEKQACTYP